MFTSCPETYQQLTQKKFFLKSNAVYIEENLLFSGRRLVALNNGVISCVKIHGAFYVHFFLGY